MRNMLAHYIITINDLARMLKYRVLDRDLSKGRPLRRGTRIGSGTPELDYPLAMVLALTDCSALAWAQGLLH